MTSLKSCKPPAVVLGVLAAAGVFGSLAARERPPTASADPSAYHVREVIAELGVPMRCSGDAGQQTAAAMIALVAESRGHKPISEVEWNAAVDRCYVLTRFREPPTVPCGDSGETLPVDEIIVNFRPNVVYVRSGKRFLVFASCSYPHLARVQDSLRAGELMSPEQLATSAPAYNHWLSAGAR